MTVSDDAGALARLACRLFGHADPVKVVLGVGRRREFFRCPRCQATLHNPGGRDE